MGVDGTSEFKRMFVLNGLGIDDQCMGLALGIDERAVGMTFRAQTLNINLSLLQLGLKRETIALDKQVTILEDHRIAGVNHILR